jgi:hypothetical protein
VLTLLRLVAIQQARPSGRLLPVFGVCVLLAAALPAVPRLFENAMGDRSLQQILRAEPASTFELRVQQIRRPAQQGRAEVLELAIEDAAGHLGRLDGDRFRITTTSSGDLRPTGRPVAVSPSIARPSSATARRAPV